MKLVSVSRSSLLQSVFPFFLALPLNSITSKFILLFVDWYYGIINNCHALHD
jgi:hypothetical protein